MSIYLEQKLEYRPTRKHKGLWRMILLSAAGMAIRKGKAALFGYLERRKAREEDEANGEEYSREGFKLKRTFLGEETEIPFAYTYNAWDESEHLSYVGKNIVTGISTRISLTRDKESKKIQYVYINSVKQDLSNERKHLEGYETFFEAMYKRLDGNYYHEKWKKRMGPQVPKSVEEIVGGLISQLMNKKE